MKVYEFLEIGDRRTKEYQLLNATLEELRQKYGEVIDGKLRLDVGIKYSEVFEFCEMEVEDAIKILKIIFLMK